MCNTYKFIKKKKKKEATYNVHELVCVRMCQPIVSPFSLGVLKGGKCTNIYIGYYCLCIVVHLGNVIM